MPNWSTRMIKEFQCWTCYSAMQNWRARITITEGENKWKNLFSAWPSMPIRLTAQHKNDKRICLVLDQLCRFRTSEQEITIKESSQCLTCYSDAELGSKNYEKVFSVFDLACLFWTGAGNKRENFFSVWAAIPMPNLRRQRTGVNGVSTRTSYSRWEWDDFFFKVFKSIMH